MGPCYSHTIREREESGVKLLIATHNRGKVAEYAQIMQDLGLELVSLADVGVDLAVEETGATYAENALIKARSYATATGLPTLGDDSGIEIDALGGEPGVYSARYGGEDASDEDRYRLVLRRMAKVPDAQRTARFRCVIALVWPDGEEDLVEGVCEGRIAREPTGTHGFGYDPVFFVPEYDRTMAELPPEVKNRISHRGRAARAARDVLARRMSERQDGS
jgi:XTP/dITP diphosphohydrolase